MTQAEATLIAPPRRTYRGDLTTPERWDTWAPRVGDVLVCTPPKSGTTWTQTMIAMLLGGGTDLPGPVPVISPWIDSVLGEAEEVAAALARQPGRRVVKTHSPADGCPLWEGVQVVAVYRHPLDVFFSLRKHAENARDFADPRMLLPVEEALAGYLTAPLDLERFDDDTLETLTRHYRETALAGRVPGLAVFHYADMIADHRGAVRRLAEVIGVAADDRLVDAVAAATEIGAMRAEAHRFVPEGGKEFWKDDAKFFDSGGLGKWRGVLAEADFALYAERLAELVPDPAARRWLEHGDRGVG